MKMDIITRLQRLCAEQGTGLDCAPEPSGKWLRERSGLSSDIADLLATAWPTDDLQVGPYSLAPLQSMSDLDRAKIALRNGYFYIGSAGNGDLLVIKTSGDSLHDCEIGLISHENLWDDDRRLYAHYEPICQGLMTLLIRAECEDDLPIDYFDAKERRNTRQ